MPMRIVAIPALTSGCPRAAASIKPTAAASTSPPSVSAGRPVLGGEDALAFLRTMRLEGTGTVRMGGALVGGLAAVVTRSGSIRVSIAIGAFEGSIRFARGSAVGRDVVGGFTASGFAAIAGLAAGGDDSSAWTRCWERALVESARATSESGAGLLSEAVRAELEGPA